MKLGLIGIVGEEAKRDFWATMARVADMGYQGIEGCEGNLLERDVKLNLRMFRELGLELLTTSANREDLAQRLDDVRRRAVDSGARRVTVWWSEANDRDVLLHEAELYERAANILSRDGLRLCYHNHDHEFRHVFDGINALELLADNTSQLAFTIDLGWAEVGGADPVRVLQELRGRVPAVHAKDFADLHDRNSFTAVGSGSVNFNRAFAVASSCGVEWVVAEQDRLRNLSAFDTAYAAALNLRERGIGV